MNRKLDEVKAADKHSQFEELKSFMTTSMLSHNTIHFKTTRQVPSNDVAKIDQ